MGRAVSTALIFQRLLNTQVWLARGQQQAALCGCLRRWPRPRCSAAPRGPPAPRGVSGDTAQPCAPTAKSGCIDLNNISHIPVYSRVCGFLYSPEAGTSALQLRPRALPGSPSGWLGRSKPAGPRALHLAAAVPALALRAWELGLSPFVCLLSSQSFGNLVLKLAGEVTAAATCSSSTTGTGSKDWTKGKDRHQPNRP